MRSSGRNRHRREDDGQTTAMVAILAVAFFALAGLLVDGGTILVSRREANALAGGAARSGAQAVDRSELRNGVTILDRSDAVHRAKDYLDAAGAAGEASADDDSVTVTVTVIAQPVFLRAFGVDGRSVSASSTARLERGR